MAYFNENDEMVIRKVKKTQDPKALPTNCVKIQRDQEPKDQDPAKDPKKKSTQRDNVF